MLVVTKPKLGDSPMTTLDFITQLFCRVDDNMTSVSKHSQANLMVVHFVKTVTDPF